MGTFGGHALPGSFFIIFGLWWTVQMFRRYFASQRKGSVPYKSSVTFPVDFICCGSAKLRRWEWEGFFKIFFTLIGFLGEVITAHKDGRFTHFGNGQHATMFFFFGMSGAVDILVYHRAPLPKDSEYLIGALSFIVEAVLFMFHLHGRTQFDVLIHTLLLYVVYGNIIVTIVEMRYRNSITVSLARAYLILLQGTWFWQAGFLLYNPLPGSVPWHDNDHDEIMVVTMMFAWHMAAIFIIMMIIGSLVAAFESRSTCCRVSGDDSKSRQYDTVRLLDRRDIDDTNGNTNKELDISDGEDIDFDRSAYRQTTALDNVIIK